MGLGAIRDGRATLEALAIAWEILDPREVRCVLMCSDDFSEALKRVRQRCEGLGNTPPPCGRIVSKAGL